MSRPISLALVTITLGLATASLAACCNAHVKRNHIIGEAMKRVPPKGKYTPLSSAMPCSYLHLVTLILSTNKLLQPAYALCVASGGLIVSLPPNTRPSQRVADRLTGDKLHPPLPHHSTKHLDPLRTKDLLPQSTLLRILDPHAYCDRYSGDYRRSNGTYSGVSGYWRSGVAEGCI